MVHIRKFYCRRLDTLSSSYIYPILESIIINFLITLRLGFNRTFMELKVDRNADADTELGGSIAPLWN